MGEGRKRDGKTKGDLNVKAVLLQAVADAQLSAHHDKAQAKYWRTEFKSLERRALKLGQQYSKLQERLAIEAVFFTGRRFMELTEAEIVRIMGVLGNRLGELRGSHD
jgi:hypothetical protein